MTKEKAKDQSEAEAGKKKKKEEEREREKKREKVRQELLKGVPTQEEKDEKKAAAKKEEVISAVAEEMLKVFSGWPEEIQALIGTDQPNKDSFVHGINYVVGAYLHRAQQVLRKQTAEGIRAKELEVARLMGPLSDQAGRLRRTQQKVNEDEIARLKAEKESKIREATAAISREYNERIRKIQYGNNGEALEAVLEQSKKLEQEYQQVKTDLTENEELLLSVIADLGKPYSLDKLPPLKMSKDAATALAVAAAVAAP
jgi:hypothetical protein